jgi:hypothetical protein
MTTGFHDDQTPSLQLYEDRSWYCFGCRIGGTNYDFAAQLWLTGQSRNDGDGVKLRGRDFVVVRQRLAEIGAMTTRRG